MPKTGRIDDIINIAAIEEQIAKTNALLKTVAAELTEIAKKSMSIKIDFAAISSTQELVKQFEKLSATNDKAAIAQAKANKLLAEKNLLEEKRAAIQSKNTISQEKENKAKTEAAIAEERLLKVQKEREITEKRLAALTTKAGKSKSSNVPDSDNSMVAEAARLQKKINDLKSDEARLTFKLREELAMLTKVRKNEVQTVQGVTDNLNALEKEVSQLTMQYDLLSRKEKESAASKELQKKIHDLNTEIREQRVLLSNMKANVGNYNQSLNGMAVTVGKSQNAFQRMGTAMSNMGERAAVAFMDMRMKAAALSAALSGTMYTIWRWIKLNATLSDSMAAVRRTTQMSNKEVYSLNEALRKLDTRTSQRSLLDLAHVAGKLGIATKEIYGFVKASDMIGVALGKDIGNNEEAINQLGRIVKLFDVDSGIGMEKALIKLGSGLKDLGNASVAEEVNIIDFTKRIGGIAPIAKVSVDKIMALAATYDILGQTTEVASTATNAIWLGMAQHTDRYAKIAGMNVKEFTQLMNKDFNEAFIAVAAGLQKNEGGFMELAEQFKGLGIDGRRVVAVMAALSGGVDIYRKQLDISHDSYVKATTVAEQYAIQNDTLAASIDKATKAMQNFFANSFILQQMKKYTDDLTAAWMKYRAALDIVTGNFEIKLKISNTEDELKKKKTDLSSETNETRKKKLQTEIALTERAIQVEKMRLKNLDDIEKLKKPSDADQMRFPGKSKEEIKALKAIEAAYKKLERQEAESQKRMDTLNKRADSVIEKSYQLRVEMGQVSLEEQQSHDEQYLKDKIDDINKAGTDELIIDAKIKAEKLGWSKKQLDEEIAQIEANATEQIINKEQSEEMMWDIEIKYARKRAEMRQEEIARQQETLKSLVESIKNKNTTEQLNVVTNLTVEKSGKLDDLMKQLQDRNITVAQYKQKEKEINEQYDREILQNSIDSIEKLITKLKEVNVDTIDLEHKLAEAKIALSNKTTAALIDDIEKRKEAEDRAEQTMMDKTMSLWNSVGSIISSAYDKEIMRIEDKIEANRYAWDQELEAAQGNEKLEKEINKRRIAEEQKLNQEKKKIAREQAVMNKVISATNAGINTAVGVTGALSSAAYLTPAGALALAIIIAAAGAAEVAAILAAPIPQYEKGRDGGKAEWAIVGEKGTEGVEMPSGKMYATPDKPTLTYLPAGSKVIPHEKFIQDPATILLNGSIQVFDIARNHARRSTSSNNRVDKSTTTLSKFTAIPYEKLVKITTGFISKNVTSTTNPAYQVTVVDPYGKEMLSEMKKTKPETRIIDMGDRMIHQTGNYTLVTRK